MQLALEIASITRGFGSGWISCRSLHSKLGLVVPVLAAIVGAVRVGLLVVHCGSGGVSAELACFFSLRLVEIVFGRFRHVGSCNR